METSKGLEHRKGAHPVTINPIGDHCYQVDGFTVSLAEYARNGSCTCHTFQKCCKYLLARTDKPWRCDHILAARDYAFETEFWALVDGNNKIIELPPTNEKTGMAL